MADVRDNFLRRICAAVVAVLAVALVAVMMSAAPASATTIGNGGRADFTAQALAADLTSAQAESLQARLNKYLAEMGGTQVAANKIQFAHGDLMLTLPGESRVRAIDSATNRLTSSPVLLADGDCAEENFCAWSGPSYTGEKVSWYRCGTYEVPDSFTGTGSWKNNQTPGTQAKFYGIFGGLHYTTPGAYSENAAYDWWPVWNIKPC